MWVGIFYGYFLYQVLKRFYMGKKKKDIITGELFIPIFRCEHGELRVGRAFRDHRVCREYAKQVIRDDIETMYEGFLVANSRIMESANGPKVTVREYYYDFLGYLEEIIERSV